MDFKDDIKLLADKIARLRENTTTEEATKNAFIMPFIQKLGFDIFDPTEVVPEYTCDVGTKKGEKIDYAIFKDGEPIILVECKHWRENLNNHSGQLLRYYHVSKAKFGLLTNGVQYRFYSDLDETNKMDEKPFFEINMDDLRENHIEKLKEFHKSYFDINTILNTASELKYTNEIRNAIMKEVNNPSDEFVKYFAKHVYSGRFKDEIIIQFREIIQQAFKQYITDMLNDRLKSAISHDTKIEVKSSEPTKPAAVVNDNDETGISRVVTTDDEMQGFFIVKSILYPAVDNIDRITHRDTQSYFGVLLDDNNRKPICRLHLNGGKKYIEIFDAEKNGTKYPMECLSEIYKYADQIKATIGFY